MHIPIPHRPSRASHFFETTLLTLLAILSLILHPSSGFLPRLLLLLQTLLVLCNYPVTRSKCALLRRSADNIGLSCGVALPVSLLATFPPNASIFLLAIATTTLVCAWKKGAVSSCTERTGFALTFAMALAWSERGEYVGFVAVLVPVVQRRIMRGLPKCFTVAEGSLVAGGICGVVAMGVSRMGKGFGNGVCEFGKDGVWGMTVCGFVGVVIGGIVGVGDVVRVRNGKGWRRLGVVGIGVVGPTYLFGWGFGGGCEPFKWVFGYVEERWERVGVLGWWILVVVVVLKVCGGEWGGKEVVVRKGYHLAVLGIFGAGEWIDREFLGFGCAVGVSGLVLMEMGRVCGVEFVEKFVHEIGGKLVDEKDRGLVKVTHVYLLVGCGVGVWGGWGSGSGVISVCVMDSVAAIGGKIFGKTRWFGGGRSIEGSLCGVLAGIVMGRLWGELEGWRGWGRLVASCVMVGGVEASTGQIDNLVLPLVYGAVVGL